VKHVTYKAKTKASSSLVAAVLPPTCLPLKLAPPSIFVLDHLPDLSREKHDPLGMSDSYRLNSPKQKCCLSTPEKERILHEIPVFS
jgi:hypothetical protein